MYHWNHVVFGDVLYDELCDLRSKTHTEYLAGRRNYIQYIYNFKEGIQIYVRRGQNPIESTEIAFCLCLPTDLVALFTNEKRHLCKLCHIS